MAAEEIEEMNDLQGIESDSDGDYEDAANLETLNPPYMAVLDAFMKNHTSSVTSVAHGLSMLYNEKLKPLEAMYHFNSFASPVLTTSDFDAKPMVMLLGPCSSGKTTLIKQLLQSSYPGSRIGLEPTTDKFFIG